MLNIQLDPNTGIAMVEPSGALSKADFSEPGSTIDPYLEQAGK